MQVESKVAADQPPDITLTPEPHWFPTCSKVMHELSSVETPNAAPAGKVEGAGRQAVRQSIATVHAV